MKTAILSMAAVLTIAVGGVRASTISGSFVQQQVFNADLTAEGTTDWAIWGQGASTSLSPTDSKLGGSGISDLTRYSNGDPLRGLGQFGNYGASSFTWSDGTNTQSASGVWGGIQNESGYNMDCAVSNGTDSCGEGFSFTVDAGTALQELVLYSDVHGGTGTLTATLSDSSAPVYTENMTFFGANLPYVSTIDFAAASEGQELTITLLLTSDSTGGTGTANVAIQAAAVSQVDSPTPEPGTLALGGMAMAGAGAFARRRKSAAR